MMTGISYCEKFQKLKPVNALIATLSRPFEKDAYTLRMYKLIFLPRGYGYILNVLA